LLQGQRESESCLAVLKAKIVAENRVFQTFEWSLYFVKAPNLNIACKKTTFLTPPHSSQS